MPGRPSANASTGQVGWWARKHPRARAQRLEMLIGILGFFTLAALMTTVVAEVQGKSALSEAAVLAAFALATFLAIRAWNRG